MLVREVLPGLVRCSSVDTGVDKGAHDDPMDGDDDNAARKSDPYPGPPLGPEYTGIHTLVLQEDQQLAWMDTAVWPPVGAVIELANPNRYVVVKDVRLRLSARGGDQGAVIVVEVQDPVERST